MPLQIAGMKPRVSLVNSMFLLDGPVSLMEALIHGTQVIVEECRGNVVILGDGGAVIGPLPPCFRIIKDQAVWTAKKNAWLESRERQIRYNDPHENLSEGRDSSDNSRRPDGKPDAYTHGPGAGATNGSRQNPHGETAPNSREGLSSLGAPLAAGALSGPAVGNEWSDGTLWNDNTGWF